MATGRLTHGMSRSYSDTTVHDLTNKPAPVVAKPACCSARRLADRPTGLPAASWSVIACFAGIAATIPLIGGCTFIWETESKAKLDLGVDARTPSDDQAAVFRDTIASYAYYVGTRPLPVRGYGLLVGLGTNGSRDCPKAIRTSLLDYIHKRHDFVGTVVGTTNVTPEQLVDSIDTAVVAVYGEIPSGTVRGGEFDVRVAALPGTGTKSIRGGRLYTVELRRFLDTPTRGSISGRVVAVAAGSVFLNPFSGGDSATRTNELDGIVINGGMVTRSRNAMLALVSPSHARAKMIQDRINSHFGRDDHVANATSPRTVEITLPERCRDDIDHTLALIRNLYLPDNARFATARASELARDLIKLDRPHAQIALCLEGLRGHALPVLDDLYGRDEHHVSFYAAAAGVRLGSHLAVDVMGLHANDPLCPFRYQAIRALARSDSIAAAATALRRLLDDKDIRIRIAAYEALVTRGDRVIESTPIGGDAFILDLVPSTRPSFIYAKRTGTERIAVFGNRPSCIPPVLYTAPNGALTLSALAGDKTLTAMRVTPWGDASPPVAAPLDVVALIELLGGRAEVRKGKILGLGLDYAAVVGAIQHLCDDQSVTAAFVFEQPNMTELFGPPKPAERPESEL